MVVREELVRPQGPLGGRGPPRSKAGTAVVTGVGVCRCGICRWGICRLPDVAPRIVHVRVARAGLRRFPPGFRFPGGFSVRFVCTRCWIRRVPCDRIRLFVLRRRPRRQGVWIGRRRKSPRDAHRMSIHRAGNSRAWRISLGDRICTLRSRVAGLEQQVDNQQQRRERCANGDEIAKQGHERRSCVTPSCEVWRALAGRVHPLDGRTRSHCSDEYRQTLVARDANGSRPSGSIGDCPERV